MSAAPEVVGSAVLRDYPLRLWARQQEHMENLLREFQLILGGEESGTTSGSVPAQLVNLATMFTTRFGALINSLNDEREAALAAGRDRMDSVVPLVEGLDELLAQVRQVLTAVDDYCRNGDLLTLARPPELVAMSEWSLSELTTQFHGGEPTPWPGPF